MSTVTSSTQFSRVRYVATNDTDLLQGLRNGDSEAYERLIRSHGSAMLAVARRLLRNEDDAHDVLQEAFLQAFRNIDRFREDARLSTWLHRIVVNAALMRLRSASRRPEQSLDDLLPRFDSEGHHASSIDELPMGIEAAFEQREIRTKIRECVERLPEQYRAAIVLRDFEELSTEEVATILGVTENAVKIRLHRARQALRTLLVRELAEAS
ncbi:MAG: sigma-70 family RNA polymerase sigma factor [Deltaproteobacteria bacterium]|nr:sigma-70 family RNA polymerase sigma factor [Deltaproteobacteria bacterium]